LRMKAIKDWLAFFQSHKLSISGFFRFFSNLTRCFSSLPPLIACIERAKTKQIKKRISLAGKSFSLYEVLERKDLRWRSHTRAQKVDCNYQGSFSLTSASHAISPWSQVRQLRRSISRLHKTLSLLTSLSQSVLHLRRQFLRERQVKGEEEVLLLARPRGT